MTPSLYKISIINDSEVIYRRTGKWNALIEEVRPQLDNLKVGKSIKIEFRDNKEALSFQSSAAKKLPTFIIGRSSLDKAIFIGRNGVKAPSREKKP